MLSKTSLYNLQLYQSSKMPVIWKKKVNIVIKMVCVDWIFNFHSFRHEKKYFYTNYFMTYGTK